MTRGDRTFTTQRPGARADLPGMDDLSLDDLEALAALADAALDEPVETLVLPPPTAPGVGLEVTYDGAGSGAATWRCGSWWCVAEVGRGDGTRKLFDFGLTDAIARSSLVEPSRKVVK
ncbi:hypothetical protein BE21_08240 [Sorangium cellulosum]|uniref:Uncharacterized protein n=1 Tax=Sorangium cellulosum TaxID=56 RepID=A0A150U2P9_SORCE|nr:hypothetical protein BE21_08240 [Sorangium cellulosum]